MTISKCKEHGAWSKEKDREIGRWSYEEIG